jgi:SAM-dependent methyltransferase
MRAIHLVGINIGLALPPEEANAFRMEAVKDYWAARPAKAASGFGAALKRSPITRGLMGFLFSLRAADEAFIARALKGKRAVLDIACGSGKPVIPAIADYVAGVDITGYPKNLALSKGYTECAEYDPPGYEFSIGRQVDAVTAINLNAHIPFESYEGILRRALAFLRPGGTVIIINEYDNAGFSYRGMKRNRAKFDRMVAGMEHWHLEKEKNFLAKLNQAFPEITRAERHPLVAGLLPSAHYHAYSTEREPTRLETSIMLLADLPLSVLNSIQCRLFKGYDRCFLVGYVFRKR